MTLVGLLWAMINPLALPCEAGDLGDDHDDLWGGSVRVPRPPRGVTYAEPLAFAPSTDDALDKRLGDQVLHRAFLDGV